jgi:xanthine dehydrogenase YagT iron-sulfur-binding subunit
MAEESLPFQESGEFDHALTFGNSETRRQFLKKISASSVALAIGPTLLSLPGISVAQSASTTLSQEIAMTEVKLRINGQEHTPNVDPRTTLLDLLRENLHLTGSKKGCDHGQCGACTVLANGRRINSCLSLAVTHDGDEITTIEGLANGDQLHPMQAAFIKHDGFQCGYCTPGQICSAVALLHEKHANSDDEIREWMSGNLCRCGAYPNILAAIKDAKKTTPA